MPRYKKQISHSFGQAEAVSRLKAFCDKARGVSDLEGSWQENRFTFSVSIQGISLKGSIDVEEEYLSFDGQLPLVAMPFVSWIPGVIQKGLSTYLDKSSPTKAERSSDQKPVVLFLHIPKAGGTTFGEFIFNQCRTEEDGDDALLKAGVLFLTYGFFKDEDSVVPKHVQSLLQRDDLHAVMGHFSFGIHEYIQRPYTYVTLLRDPVQRVVSLYHYLKLEDRMSLEEFVLNPPFKEVDNDQTRRIAGVDPAIGACTSATLETAKENLLRSFSIVGVTERLDETLIALKQKMGWNRDVISYPRNVNATSKGTYSLPTHVRDAVRSRNELDVELWNFASQLLDDAVENNRRSSVDDLSVNKLAIAK